MSFSAEPGVLENPFQFTSKSGWLDAKKSAALLLAAADAPVAKKLAEETAAREAEAIAQAAAAAKKLAEETAAREAEEIAQAAAAAKKLAEETAAREAGEIAQAAAVAMKVAEEKAAREAEEMAQAAAVAKVAEEKAAREVQERAVLSDHVAALKVALKSLKDKQAELEGGLSYVRSVLAFLISLLALGAFFLSVPLFA